MALPPNIPTSFVPHGNAAPRQFRGDLTGAFAFFGYGVLALVFVMALGVFLYGRVLAAEQAANDKELATAQQAVDEDTVTAFVRLRDRLTSGKTLLGNHVALSTFFASLEKILPSTVRFNTLHITTGKEGTTRLEGSGIAKNFNALAFASTAFASDGRIKDAIFSGISVHRDNSVSFSLSATLDPKMTVFTP